MVYLRALGLAGLFLFFVLWTLLMRAAGRRLLRAWGVLQEASMRFLRYMAARILDQQPAVRRRRLDQLAGLVRLLPDKISCSPARLGREGLTGQWLVPPEAPDNAPVVYYLHGGGYIICSSATHRLLMTRLARAAGARVLGLDYRLAPEHPFPAAVEDAVAGYRWLLAQGHPADRVVFAGDSAGGGLALAAMLYIKQEGLPLPAGAALLSPWVDLAAEDASIREHAHLDYASPKRDQFTRLSELYLADADPRDPLASPIRGDLTGLPPLLIHAGGVEVLRGQVERLAQRAKQAGVEVQLCVYDHMVHVWQAFPHVFPQAAQATAEIGAFVKRRAGR